MSGHGRGPHWWAPKFKKCGFKLTVTRNLIVQILERADSHLCAEDIYMAVHKEYPNIGLTTVYRTLDMLGKMGMLHRFEFGDGRARYELAVGPREKDHHHHLVCTGCHRVINYSDFIENEVEFIQQIETGLSKKFKFKISHHDIQFYGLCQQCQAG